VSLFSLSRSVFTLSLMRAGRSLPLSCDAYMVSWQFLIFTAFGDVGGCRCGALSMSRWNSGIRRHTGAYSLLCEQQFGEGAEFDGEMCACRKGYVRAPLRLPLLLA